MTKKWKLMSSKWANDKGDISCSGDGNDLQMQLQLLTLLQHSVWEIKTSFLFLQDRQYQTLWKTTILSIFFLFSVWVGLKLLDINLTMFKVHKYFTQSVAINLNSVLSAQIF